MDPQYSCTNNLSLANNKESVVHLLVGEGCSEGWMHKKQQLPACPEEPRNNIIYMYDL